MASLLPSVGVEVMREAEATEASLRERSIEALAAGNEDPAAFRVTSEYLVYEVRPGAAAGRVSAS